MLESASDEPALARRPRTGSAARRLVSRPAVVAASVLLVLAVVGLLFWLLWRSPPAAVCLLPEADAVVYADVRPIRLLTRIEQRPVEHSPEYQSFIDRTGIVPERDLDRAAFALHRMADPAGPNGVVGYSEVFTGRFDRDRLTSYLRSIATGQESYAGHEIFTVPVADPTPRGTRLLRLSVLDPATVAASNMPSPEQIHAMIDSSRSPGWLRSGSSLVSSGFHRVPLGASVWGIGALALPFVEDGHVAILGLQLPIPAAQPIIASLRYTTALHLRLELLAGSDTTAATQTEALRGMLGLARALVAVDKNAGTAAAADLLASVQVEQQHERTVLEAVIPISLLRTLTGSAPIATRRSASGSGSVAKVPGAMSPGDASKERATWPKPRLDPAREDLSASKPDRRPTYMPLTRGFENVNSDLSTH